METNESKINENINEGKPVIVDFWAPWCGPCKLVGPIIEKLAEKYSDTLTITKVNVDESIEMSDKYGIRNIPTILFFKNGEIVDKQVGATTEAAIEAKIANLLNT